MKKRKPKVIAYLRVSPRDPDTEKNKADILKFANDKDYGQVHFVEEKVTRRKTWKERKIKGIIDELEKDDRLIVPEMSRLGQSMLEIMEILAVAEEKGIAIHAVKNGWELNGSIQSKGLAVAFSIAAEIERDLISKRTVEGIRAAKAKGKQLGRPKGPGKSKLDAYKPEIVALLKNGSSKTFVAKRYGTTPVNLWNWLKKNRIEATARP